MNSSPFRTWKRLQPVRRPRGKRGLALVETAVLLMVAATILLGIMQFGYVYFVHQKMQNAAQDAARVAAGRNASANDAISVAHDRLNGFPLAFDVEVEIPEEAVSLNRNVRVSISTPMKGLSFGLLGDGDLRAQATVRREAGAV